MFKIAKWKDKWINKNNWPAANLPKEFIHL